MNLFSFYTIGYHLAAARCSTLKCSVTVFFSIKKCNYINIAHCNAVIKIVHVFLTKPINDDNLMKKQFVNKKINFANFLVCENNIPSWRIRIFVLASA